MMNKAVSKVLVIDDEPGVRESLKFLMMDDYSVFSAETMASGISLVKDLHPDTVILDLKLPDMHGIDGLREIRKYDSKVSIIILTGYGDMKSAREAIELGVNGYVSKPFKSNDMLQLIRKSIQNSQEQRNNAVSQSKLVELNETLPGGERKKNKLAELGQISAEYAHDLCGPLTAVVGYIDVVSRYLSKTDCSIDHRLDKIRSLMPAIEKNVNRCYDLSKQWLTNADINEDSKKKIDVCDILNQVFEELHVEVAESASRITLDIDHCSEKPYTIWGGKLEIFRALSNIVRNALQSLPNENGLVNISIYQQENSIIIQVSDNGCGISTGEMQHVFDPYFTTKLSTKNTGTGLGLYIAKRIIDDHEGSITINSPKLFGTEIKVILPLFENGTQPSD